MRNFSYILFIAVVAVVACKRGDKNQTVQTTTEQTAPVELPKTPEAVVRTWEAQVEKNQFALPKLISIGKTLETVVSLDSTNKIEPIPPMNTKILSISCTEKGEKAAFAKE